jgi:hypothetical protein
MIGVGRFEYLVFDFVSDLGFSRVRNGDNILREKFRHVSLCRNTKDVRVLFRFE